ncbi:MAG: class IV adenylate cyclase [Anaerolineae bacterium]
MATNIEIKARIQDLEHLKGLVERLSDGPGLNIPQEDTFFHVPRGRLKLRCLSPEQGQLIYYEREDASGPRPSNYLVYVTRDPESLKVALSAALGVRGVVRKQRWLYHVGQTRVHLDEVAGLGWFLELEVVLSPGQSQAEGVAIAHKLMAQLGIEEADLVERAYIDLLL